MLKTIQALRAIAAMMVVAYHSVVTLPAAIRPRTGALAESGAAGVDIFFIVSGFIMVYGNYDKFQVSGEPLRFLRNRFLRIAPAYYVVTTGVVLILLFAPSLYHNLRFDWSNAVFSYLFVLSKNSAGSAGTVLGVGWTLCFEMFFYVLFACAMLVQRERGLVLLTLSFVALFTLTNLVVPDSTASLVMSSSIVFEFAAGCWIGYAFKRGIRLPRSMSVTLTAAGFAALLITSAAGLIVSALGDMRLLGFGLPCALIVIGVVSLEGRSSDRIPSAVLHVGESSYSTYLVHQFALQAVYVAALAVGIGAAWWFPLAFFGCLASAVGGHSFYLCVERPASRILRSMRAGSPTSRVDQLT